MIDIRVSLITGLIIVAGMALSPASQAARFSPVTQQAQMRLAQLGFDPGTADGIFGPRTSAAIKDFQKQSGLPETGTLDSATLAKLDSGDQAPQVDTVKDWRPVLSQDELDKLAANPANNPSFPYTDYRPNAPAANMVFQELPYWPL